MNRDFFDEDLVKPREEIKRIRMGPADAAGESPPVDASQPGPNRPVSDLNISMMTRHRKRVESDSARAAEELDRLRRQQEELEREKRELEDARDKQSRYEKGKRELVSGLHESLVTLERNEVKAQQMADMFKATRKRFREMLAEIAALDENTWPEDRVREELGKALVRVDDARMEFNKAMARIEAVLKPEAGAEPGPILLDAAGARPIEEKAFADWIRIGFAVSLPLLILLAALCAVLIWQALA